MEREPTSTLNQQYLSAILPRTRNIYVLYASPRRSYVRVIEKTVSSLIPPTATFRLPAAWQRIGSRNWEEREGKESHRRGTQKCGERARSFEQSYAILMPLPIPPYRSDRNLALPPEKWDSSDLFQTREQGLFRLPMDPKLY